MTLTQELSSDQKRALGSTCHVCLYIASLPVDQQREWNTELAKPVKLVSHASVYRALRRREVETSEPGVKRHRRNHA